MKTLTDMLISISNASRSNKKQVSVKINNLSTTILMKLRKLHYIDYFQVYSVKNQYWAKINLRYLRTIPVITKIIIFSKPSRILHYRYRDICSISNIYPFLGFFHTPKGVLTHLECLKKNTGGKFLFLIL